MFLLVYLNYMCVLTSDEGQSFHTHAHMIIGHIYSYISIHISIVEMATRIAKFIKAVCVFVFFFFLLLTSTKGDLFTPHFVACILHTSILYSTKK